MIVLVPDPHARSDAVAVALRPDQLEDDPMVFVGADVLPQLGGVLER